MALQLGSLRDALIEAKVSPEKAAAAAEEVAGYENRLTRLATWVQICVAMLLLLLGSQGALWIEIGKLDGKLTATDSQLTALRSETSGQLSSLRNETDGQLKGLRSETADIRAQLAQISAQLSRLTH